jgi:hypothetical protein
MWWKNVDKRFEDLDKKIEKVSGVLTKFMWLVLGGIVMAFVAFIVNGGLRVPWSRYWERYCLALDLRSLIRMRKKSAATPAKPGPKVQAQ